jgi:hypothetical protein
VQVPDTDPPPSTLPLTLGVLRFPLTWFPDEPGSRVEVAQCRIEVICPVCRHRSRHGWKLDGTARIEQRVCHGHCGCIYCLSPAARADHAIDPMKRLEGPGLQRRAGR